MTAYVNDAASLIRAKKGDREALEQVVSTNLGLVKSIAMRFAGRGVETEDLIQLGTVGMLKAIQGFDPDRQCRFSTYAVPHIAGEIRRFLRSDGQVKVSREIRANGAAILRFTKEYETARGEEPTVEEICRGTGLSREDVALALSANRPALSLSARDEESGFSPEDLVGEDSMEGAIMGLALREAVARLPEGERKLVICRYYKSLTQEQTARILGVTQVKVSREEKRILQKLREEFPDR